MTVADLVAALEPLSSFDAEFVAVIDDDPRTGFCNNFDPPQVPGLWLVSDKAEVVLVLSRPDLPARALKAALVLRGAVKHPPLTEDRGAGVDP